MRGSLKEFINLFNSYDPLGKLKEPRICPFCDNTNLDVIDYVDPPTDDRKYQVYCYICGAGGPFEPSYEEAIESWNKERHV